jgi:hypothetical protein
MADRPSRQIKITRPLDPGDPTQRPIITELAQRRATLAHAAERTRSQRWRPLAFGLAAQGLLAALAILVQFGQDDRLRVIVAAAAGLATAAAMLLLVQDWLRLRHLRRTLTRAAPWLPSTGILGDDGLGNGARDGWPVWAMVAGLGIGAAFVYAFLLPGFGEWFFRLIGAI